MTPWLTGKLLLPLHERLRGRETMAYYHSLKASHQGTVEQLEQARAKKFQQLLRHCRQNVPYYRKILPDDDITLEQLTELPVLERETIRGHLTDLTASNYQDRLIRYNTGGSTGEPLVFYTEKVKEARHNAYKMRCRNWHGIAPGDREVDFWGSPIELDNQSRLRIWKDQWLLNTVLLSAFDLNEQRLHDYALFLAKFKPRLIYGYPTVTYRVAQYIHDTELDLGGYGPAVISCTAEMLFDHQRQLMQAVFNCPVVNEYGSRDGGLIAHECPHGTMHIAAEHVVVEVDQPDAQGVGDLLITNLDAYGMPLLRYRIGDRGKLSDTRCDCGLPLPIMDAIAGRSNDFVKGQGGRLIHSLAPVYVLRELTQIRQFKMIQKPDLSLEIQLVLREPLAAADYRAINEKMNKVFGFGITIDFKEIAVIAPEKSGKYRWVVCQA